MNCQTHSPDAPQSMPPPQSYCSHMFKHNFTHILAMSILYLATAAKLRSTQTIQMCMRLCFELLTCALSLSVEHEPPPQTIRFHPAVLCCRLHLAPAEPEAQCPHFPLQISFPSVSRSSSSSVALWHPL